MKTNIITFMLLISAGLMLTGCPERTAEVEREKQPQPEAAPARPMNAHTQNCPPDCTVDIQLPGDDQPGQSPHGFPDVFRIVENTAFDFQVTGTQARGAVVLSFKKPVVRRAPQQGQQSPWLYTVKLNPGNNAFTIRDYDAGMCHDRDGGCKFVVINLGSPHQPSVIGSPTVVIDPN